MAPHFGAVLALRTSSMDLYGVSARMYKSWFDVTVLPIQLNFAQSYLTSDFLINWLK